MTNHDIHSKLHSLAQTCLSIPRFSEQTYKDNQVMRGLRDEHGTGVIAGLTCAPNACSPRALRLWIRT